MLLFLLNRMLFVKLPRHRLCLVLWLVDAHSAGVRNGTGQRLCHAREREREREEETGMRKSTHHVSPELGAIAIICEE